MPRFPTDARKSVACDGGRRRAIGALACPLVAWVPGAARATAVSGALAGCEGAAPSTASADLADAHAPRIMLIQGSAPWITMEPFADFLEAMGYPRAKLVDAASGTRSYSGYLSGERLAGVAAWYREREGAMPMLVGHSMGGMRVLQALHALAGTFGKSLAVVEPSGDELPRDYIVDAKTGERQSVVGLRVSFAAALATGFLPRLFLGQWRMLDKLREVPDSVEEFTGVTVPFDPIAGNLATGEPYRATGSAHVRNLIVPPSYRHLDLPDAARLADDSAARAFIDAYVPGTALPADLEHVPNLLHAADIWFSVKTHWCLATLTARRARGTPLA